MKRTLSTRNPFSLWLALLIPVGIVAAAIYYVALVRPQDVRRQNAMQSLAECRNQVSAELWDDAEPVCEEALRLATADLSAEANQLLQGARNGWLDYHYTRGENLLAVGEPDLALAELDLVFDKDPGFRFVGTLRQQARIALTPTSTPTLRPGETPPTSTSTGTPTFTPIFTPDETATSAAQATAVALAVVQTLEAQRQAEAIAATLTARAPRPTSTPPATVTPRRAVAPTPTRTRTPAPTPNRTATARVQTTATARSGVTATALTAQAGRSQGAVIDGPLNVRSGPGTIYPQVAQLQTNEQFEILGRSADSTWLQIETSSGVTGWIATGYVRTGQEVTRYQTRAAPPTPVTCAIPVDGGLASLWNRGELGCARGPAALVWSAWQPFERGHMLWRRDTDAAYVFYNSGGWLRASERWSEGIEIRSRGAPPGGLQSPVRGFGYIWGLHDEIFQGLGWARDKEKGFCALIQEFDQGFVLRSSTVSSCWNNLYNHATEPGFGLSSIKANTAGYWQ